MKLQIFKKLFKRIKAMSSRPKGEVRNISVLVDGNVVTKTARIPPEEVEASYNFVMNHCLDECRLPDMLSAVAAAERLKKPAIDFVPDITFPIMSLPQEIILHVLTFLDWPTLISFLCTSKVLTGDIVTLSDVRRLRQLYNQQLSTEEQAVRESLNIPYLSLLASTRERYYQTPKALWGKWGPELPKGLACYTCLRWVPMYLFSTNQTLGPLAIGQPLSTQRICIPCGRRTGFYGPGSRPSAKTGVCARCTALMITHSGGQRVDECFRKIGRRGTLDDSSNDRNYWWNRTHWCYPCLAQAGIVESELQKCVPRARPKRDKYVRSLLARKVERQERGRRLRAEKGYPEPDHMKDWKALAERYEAVYAVKRKREEAKRELARRGYGAEGVPEDGLGARAEDAELELELQAFDPLPKYKSRAAMHRVERWHPKAGPYRPFYEVVDEAAARSRKAVVTAGGEQPEVSLALRQIDVHSNESVKLLL